MSYRLALGGLGLTAVAVLTATGCRAARTGALEDTGIGHGAAHRIAGGEGLRLATPVPQAAPPAARGAPHVRHMLPRSLRSLPGLRHLPTLPPRRGLGPAARPEPGCTTVSLGPGRGSSMQCVQQSDQVITKSRHQTSGDDWPDGGWSDRDSDRDHGRGGRGWPDLGLDRGD